MHVQTLRLRITSDEVISSVQAWTLTPTERWAVLHIAQSSCHDSFLFKFVAANVQLQLNIVIYVIVVSAFQQCPLYRL